MYVGINTGMNSLIRPALYQSFHRITNLTRCDSNDAVYERARLATFLVYNALCFGRELVSVCGPICESGDILGRFVV